MTEGKFYKVLGAVQHLPNDMFASQMIKDALARNWKEVLDEAKQEFYELIKIYGQSMKAGKPGRYYDDVNYCVSKWFGEAEK